MASLIDPVDSQPATQPPVALVERLRSAWLPLLAIWLTILALTAAGLLHTYFRTRQTQGERLTAMASVKSRQLADWVNERLGDARFIHTSRHWAQLYRRWHEQGDLAAAAELRGRLQEHAQSKAIQSLALFDGQGGLMWSTEAMQPSALLQQRRGLHRLGRPHQAALPVEQRQRLDRLALRMLLQASAQLGRGGQVALLVPAPVELGPVPAGVDEACVAQALVDPVGQLPRLHAGHRGEPLALGLPGAEIGVQQAGGGQCQDGQPDRQQGQPGRAQALDQGHRRLGGGLGIDGVDQGRHGRDSAGRIRSAPHQCIATAGCTSRWRWATSTKRSKWRSKTSTTAGSKWLPRPSQIMRRASSKLNARL